MAEDKNKNIKVVESGWDDEVSSDGKVKVIESGWDDDIADGGTVKKKVESGTSVPSPYPMGRGPLASPIQIGQREEIETPTWQQQKEVERKRAGASVPADQKAASEIKLPTFAKTRAEAEAIKPSPVYPTGDKAIERIGLLEMRKDWLNKKMNLGATIIKGLETEFEKSEKRVQEKQAYVNSLQNELNRRSDISDAAKKQVYDAAVADYQTAFGEYETTRKNLEKQYKRLEIADKKMLEASEEESKIAKQQSKIGSAYDALNSGLSNLWAMTLRAPEYAYNQMINAQNNVFRAIGAESLVVPLQKGGILSDAAKHFEANAEAYSLVRSKKYAEYENSISKALEKKDYNAAVDLAAQGIIESAPITAGISLATMAGATPAGIVLGGGVVFGGEKYKQLEEEYGSKIDENTKMANSFSTGLIEGVFEELGTAKIIESLVGRGLGKKALEEQARTTFQRIYKNALLKVTPAAAATMEGLSEAETTFAENVIDIASGIKAPDQVLDGVEDAFYVGAGTGAIMGFLLKPKNDPVDPELRRKTNDAKSRLDRLNATIADPNVPDAIKQAVNDQASAIATEIIEANEQDDEMTKGFSQDAIKRLEAIGSEVDELEKGLESVTDEVSKEAVNKKIEELNKERDFIYNLQYTKETLRKQRDIEIQELEKIRPDLTDQDLLLTDLPASVDKTLDRVYEGTPTDPVQIQEAIDALDKKFDELEAYKKDPKRTHTTEVIDSLIDVLSEAKSTLQRYENEVRPTEARAEEGAGKPEIQATKGVTPEQKAAGGEVTAPSVPAIEAAEDISKEDENYRQSREVTEAVSKENPDASVLITPRGNDLNLAAVYVGKEKRGKGIGSKVLDSVKRQADRLGKKVVLDATNELDEETDLEKLGKFYERNGFVKVGENKYEYNPPKGGGIAAPSVPAIETKPTQYDKENIQGVSGEERVGQEPKQAKPEQKGGAEAPSAGGILQATEEEIAATAKALEGVEDSELDRIAKSGEMPIKLSDTKELDNEINRLRSNAKLLRDKGKIEFAEEQEQAANETEKRKSLVPSKAVQLSEVYHKAKADGSNPELVAAVEQLLKPATDETKTETKDGEPLPKGVSGIRPEGEGREKGAELRPEAEEEVDAEREELLMTGEAEERREKGRYTKDGVEYVRQKPDKGIRGNKGEVRFAKGIEVPFTYKLIERKRAQASHRSGLRNPMHFVPETQPKNRTDKESIAAELDFANNPDWLRLGAMPDAYSGAPIVLPTDEGIQGHNRLAGLSLGYSFGNMAYKEMLVENAEQFGFTKEQVMAMEEPILVREVNVSDEYAIELGNYKYADLETGGIGRIDPVSLVRRIPVPRKLQLMDLVITDDTINASIRKNFTEVYNILRRYLNSAQRSGLMKPDGEPTTSAVMEIETLINQFLFDGGDVSLSEIFENLPYNAREGLKRSLRYLLVADKEKSLLPEVQEAIVIMRKFDLSGSESFETFLKQIDAFNPDYPTPSDLYDPVAIEIARRIIPERKITAIPLIFGEYKNLTIGKKKPKKGEQFQAGMSFPTEGETQEEEVILTKAEAIQTLFNIDYEKESKFKRRESAKRGGAEVSEQEVPAEPKEPAEPQKPETEVKVETDTELAANEIAKAFTNRFGINTFVIDSKKLEELLSEEKNSKEFFFQILDEVDVFDSRNPQEAKEFITRVFRTVSNKEDAKKAYRKLALKYHPDKQGSQEIMQHLNNVNEKYQKGLLQDTKQAKAPFMEEEEDRYDEWMEQMARRAAAESRKYERAAYAKSQAYTKQTYGKKREEAPKQPRPEAPKQPKAETKQAPIVEEQKAEAKPSEVKKGFFASLFNLFSRPVVEKPVGEILTYEKYNEAKRKLAEKTEELKEANRKKFENSQKENKNTFGANTTEWLEKDKAIRDKYIEEWKRIDEWALETRNNIETAYEKKKPFAFRQYVGGKISGIYNPITLESFVVLDNIDETTFIHEAFSHPFIEAIKERNPDLYNNLLAEAKKESQIVDYVNENYGNQSEKVRDAEYIARAIDLDAKGKLKNKKLIDYIKEFWNEANKIFKDIFGGRVAKIENIDSNTTISDIVDFVLTSNQKLDLRAEPQKPAGAEVKPSAPAQAPASVPADLASAISQTSELYSRIYDPETTAKEKREIKNQIKEMLKDYPYLEYIYNNIKDINSQLENLGMLTKEGDCP